MRPASWNSGTRRASGLPRYARIEVRGKWDGSRQFLLDNRTRDGRAGYEVLTPLALDDGRWLLVNRGSVPFGGYRDRLPDVGIVAPGCSEIRGLLDDLRNPDSRPAGRAGYERTLAASDGVSAVRGTRPLARGRRRASRARVLLLDEAAPQGYMRGWKPFVKGPERNWSYANPVVEFAVLLIVLYVGLNLRKRQSQ
jgi:surfeit locus 1 family protein